MPITNSYDIESPLRSFSSITKHNRYLLLFLIIMGLFMAIYIPLRLIPQNKNDD